MSDSGTGNDAYDYGRTRVAGVFGLAGVAAASSLLLVWGAWSVIDKATQERHIAQPPNLKNVVGQIESDTRVIAAKIGREHRAEAKPPL